MTEITMDAWVFALAIAGTALSAAGLVGFGLAMLVAAGRETPSPLKEAVVILAEDTARELHDHLCEEGTGIGMKDAINRYEEVSHAG